MPTTLVAVSFETRNVQVESAFWAALLGRNVLRDGSAAFVPGNPTQVGLRFVPQRTEKRETNRLHLHVTAATAVDQQRLIDDVLRLGGSRRGTGPLPIGRDVYLNAPDGDEFCVIAPDNAFLAGCGTLGEVTCEGAPAAGRFWLDALGWAAVWDRDEQFAIQSHAGGTKLSWDGPSSSDSPGWNRQRFVLAATDFSADTDRLTALGATPLHGNHEALLMADPDGSEFLLLRS